MTDDGTTAFPTLDTLCTAYDLLCERGWTRGQNVDTDGCLCARSAVMVAAGYRIETAGGRSWLNWHTPGGGAGDPANRRIGRAATTAAKSLVDANHLASPTDTRSPGSVLADKNDHSSTMWPVVKDMFEAAITHEAEAAAVVR